jgi:hypothetical protein
MPLCNMVDQESSHIEDRMVKAQHDNHAGKLITGGTNIKLVKASWITLNSFSTSNKQAVLQTESFVEQSDAGSLKS